MAPVSEFRVNEEDFGANIRSTRRGERAWVAGQGRTSSQPKQVADLPEEPVRRAVQVAQAKLVRLGQGRAIAQVDQCPRDRAVAEQPVHTELVGDLPRVPYALDQDRMPRTVDQRAALARRVLAHEPQEERPRHLILDLK